MGLALPLALLTWLLLARPRSRTHLLAVAMLAALAPAAISASGLGQWHVLGRVWPILFLAMLLIGLALRVRRPLPAAWFPRAWSGEAVLLPLLATGVIFYGWMLITSLQSRSYEGAALRLAPPLRGGVFYVMAGGSSILTNQHVYSDAQRYAMDITRFGPLGLRANGLFPDRLDAYAVYGAEIVAPCTGEIVAAETAKPDQPVLQADWNDHAGGNHVVIFCQGHSILLAHMQPGSVRVRVGQQVATGEALGRVGNSGNTIEPHLHIGAVRGRHVSDNRDRTQQSVPILIGGRFLVKGDEFEAAD